MVHFGETIYYVSWCDDSGRFAISYEIISKWVEKARVRMQVAKLQNHAIIILMCMQTSCVYFTDIRTAEEEIIRFNQFFREQLNSDRLIIWPRSCFVGSAVCEMITDIE